ncbi:amidophosphoribosyltransferase [Candidatus Sumerlaeota bacterium]|nr:amidophosphoribosyltransferase [Candidatus Sumerlaeota bacterium]
MGGIFGVASKNDCVQDLFYGTDYHSHLGTCRGGLAVKNGGFFTRSIHDITNAQFRSKFENDIQGMEGNMGIGVISDNESQPLIIGSRLGAFAIVTVGMIRNIDALAKKAFQSNGVHFSEMSGGGINPTELVATLISHENSFQDGIASAQEQIEGSCSVLLLTEQGIYAGRDRLGRTPLVIGKKQDAIAVALESTAFPNLLYDVEYNLGPGEIAFLSPEGYDIRKKAGGKMQICSFLWVYFGFPASTYEGVNVEEARNRCGKALALKDDVDVDYVSSIPDSGTGHAIGYANAKKIPYKRPLAKYTPTWPRSFMPQDQATRDLVARMKLIPSKELIQGQKILFCEDSIVRGTQLKDTIQRMYGWGAREVHMRPASPPLVFSCRFLNFSRSKSEMDLAARRAIRELEGSGDVDVSEYIKEGSDKFNAMVDRIRHRLALTTLKYQELDDLISAIGLPREKLCTYCWNGSEE